MSTPNFWDSLPATIEHGGGFMRMSVRALRQLDGAGALKVNVVARIESELAARKIGHLPSAIPRDQDTVVLLYNQDKNNLGLVLHLAHQLARGRGDDGQPASTLVSTLDLALQQYRSAVPTPGAKP
ncbi:hypothetical protein [Streptomyces lavendulocolor]|uniref:hypothetical protein n=1 Tax=Streptomyces lavendulocolor TaxID=67316 RepID=UPI0031D69C93